ncbi:MAG: hypothetical protein COB46_00535 [Rhodospirillaceae bacterium]|nr:MAG: hypothetical protein COB46_00535 [Rhodospirillaceae bacterium]
MAKFGKAFMSLFLDKKARDSLKNKPLRPARPDLKPVADQAPAPAQQPHLTPEEICERLVEAEQEMTKKRSPERLQLIQNALKIRSEQAKIFNQLSEEQRQKLQEIAMSSFVNGGKD